jgi:hypothetical protein
MENATINENEFPDKTPTERRSTKTKKQAI